MKRWLLVLCAVAFVLGSSARGFAQATLPADVTLRWQAPAECPQAEQARAELASALVQLEAAELPALEIDAQISPEPGQGYRLQLEFRGDRTGQRSLVVSSCVALARTAAAIAALVAGEPAVAPPAPEPSPAAAPPPAAAAPTDEASPPSRLHASFLVGAAGAGELGSLPRAVLGVALSGQARFSWLGVGLEGSFFPGTEDALVPGAVRFSFWRLALVGCAGSLEVAGCAGMSAGSISAASSGVERERAREDAWLAPLLGGLVRLPLLSDLLLRIEVRALVPLRRPTWTVADYPFSHRAAPVAAGALVGLDYSLDGQ